MLHLPLEWHKLKEKETMRKTLGSLLASVVFFAMVVMSSSRGFEPSPVSHVEPSQNSTAGEIVTSQVAPDALADYAMEVSPLPPNIEIRRHVVGAGPGDRSRAAEATLVYSNTIGSNVWGPPDVVAGFPFADDITTTVESGCPLDRYEFLISGDMYGDGSGVGPFSVDFALFDACPGGGGDPIPGTEGRADLPDAGFHMVSFQVPDGVDVPLPSSFWLQLNFSRARCGVVDGAPATMGFSADFFDVAGYPCVAFHGGYPGGILRHFPHASFYLDVYVRGECGSKYPVYWNRNKVMDSFNRGTIRHFADDLILAVDGCDMVAYEVGLKGDGRIDIALATALDDTQPWANVIPGTQTRYFGIGDYDPQVVRVEFDPPIAIPHELWIKYFASSGDTGPIVTSRPASLGETADSYAYYDSTAGRWVDAQIQGGRQYSAFDVTIECAGTLPAGACCDLFNLDDQGEAVCREVPEMNCPENRWLEGSACDPDPFAPGCGVSACCTPEDTCENITRNDCTSLAPPDERILWVRGRFCEDDHFYCPRYACLNRGFGNSCAVSGDGPGCTNPFCCTDVCNVDPWCCEVAWDEVCIRSVDELCDYRPDNDECLTAEPVDVNGYVVLTNRVETSEVGSGFCCHEGYACPNGVCGIPYGQERGVCDGGGRDGKACTTPEFDPELALSGPGSLGAGTVWFTFEATDTSARVHTCNSVDSYGDSLLQVYRSVDPSTQETACSTVEMIGCSDDADRCGNGLQSSVCVTGLVVGETYYVTLAAKTPEDSGLYRLDVESPCTSAVVRPSNDYCHQAQTIESGETPFDLVGATFQCPGEDCASDALVSDLWYDWTAPADGSCQITTCQTDRSASGQADTTLIVYAGTDCPPDSAGIVGCSLETGGDCGASSTVEFLVTAGQAFKIRLGGPLGGHPTGKITVNFRDACPTGPIDWIDPPNGVIDARQPGDPMDFDAPQGIDSLIVRSPKFSAFDLPQCVARWSVCETVVEGFPNEVVDVVDNLDGTYTVELARRISAGAVTRLTYTDPNGTEHSTVLTFQPADVDADGTSQSRDILAIIDILNGAFSAPWGIYSCDTDHSGACHAPDILRVIDLLNGVIGGVPWIGQNPSGCGDCCP